MRDTAVGGRCLHLCYEREMIVVMRQGYVYILASKRNGTLYLGVTNDLQRRLHEHQNELLPGFSQRYDVKTLVWFETHALITDAI